MPENPFSKAHETQCLTKHTKDPVPTCFCLACPPAKIRFHKPVSLTLRKIDSDLWVIGARRQSSFRRAYFFTPSAGERIVDSRRSANMLSSSTG